MGKRKEEKRKRKEDSLIRNHWRDGANLAGDRARELGVIVCFREVVNSNLPSRELSAIQCLVGTLCPSDDLKLEENVTLREKRRREC